MNATLHITSAVKLTTILLAMSATGLAQTLQQPVTSRSGVATSVSVPDRGSTLLGGVSSRAAGSNSYGFGRPQSSFGSETTAGSQRVSVFIHDLRAMDEAILESAAESELTTPARTSLLERPVNSVSTSQRLRQLAEQAEARHKPHLARLYRDAAAKQDARSSREGPQGATLRSNRK